VAISAKAAKCGMYVAAQWLSFSWQLKISCVALSKSTFSSYWPVAIEKACNQRKMVAGEASKLSLIQLSCNLLAES